MPYCGKSDPTPEPKPVKYVRPVVCVACGGRGRASNNTDCVPCEGTGVKDGKRKTKKEKE